MYSENAVPLLPDAN